MTQVLLRNRYFIVYTDGTAKWTKNSAACPNKYYHEVAPEWASILKKEILTKSFCIGKYYKIECGIVSEDVYKQSCICEINWPEPSKSGSNTMLKITESKKKLVSESFSHLVKGQVFKLLDGSNFYLKIGTSYDSENAFSLKDFMKITLAEHSQCIKVNAELMISEN